MKGNWKRTRAYFPERFIPVLEQIEDLSKSEGFEGDINQFILEGLMRVLENREDMRMATGKSEDYQIRKEKERLARKFFGGSLDANGKF